MGLKWDIDGLKLIPPFFDQVIHDLPGDLRNSFVGVDKPKPFIACLRNGEISRGIEVRNQGMRNDSIHKRFSQVPRLIAAFHIDQQDLGHMGTQGRDTVDDVVFFVCARITPVIMFSLPFNGCRRVARVAAEN